MVENVFKEGGWPIPGSHLVDPGEDSEPGTQDDKIATSTEHSYQYFTGFEDIYPPNKGYITLTTTLIVSRKRHCKTSYTQQ